MCRATDRVDGAVGWAKAHPRAPITHNAHVKGGPATPTLQLGRRTYTAQTYTGNQSSYQAVPLCLAQELVYHWESGSVLLGHSNRHLNEIEAPIKNDGTRQLRRDPGRKM